MTKVDEIARRYFVMNAFDGALTVLGVMVGSYAAGSPNPRFIVGACIGGAIAMGVSGFVGAFMAERAERVRRLKELESVLFMKLDHSVLAEAARFAVLFTALIDGLSPAFVAVLSIIPFFMALKGLIAVNLAFLLSLATNLTILFLLGMFLGRVARENWVLHGLLMVSAGLLTAVICSLFKLF